MQDTGGDEQRDLGTNNDDDDDDDDDDLDVEWLVKQAVDWKLAFDEEKGGE